MKYENKFSSPYYGRIENVPIIVIANDRRECGNLIYYVNQRVEIATSASGKLAMTLPKVLQQALIRYFRYDCYQNNRLH